MQSSSFLRGSVDGAVSHAAQYGTVCTDTERRYTGVTSDHSPVYPLLTRARPGV